MNNPLATYFAVGMVLWCAVGLILYVIRGREEFKNYINWYPVTASASGVFAIILMWVAGYDMNFVGWL